MDSGQTYGVSTQNLLFLLHKERLIKTTSMDEMKKQLLPLPVGQPVANHSATSPLYSEDVDNRFFRNNGAFARLYDVTVLSHTPSSQTSVC